MTKTNKVLFYKSCKGNHVNGEQFVQGDLGGIAWSKTCRAELRKKF